MPYAAATPAKAAAVVEKSRYSQQYERLLKALRDARTMAGMTQQQVADAFGTHPSFVSKCEHGDRRIDVVELAAFCRLYGIRVAAILKAAKIE